MNYRSDAPHPWPSRIRWNRSRQFQRDLLGGKTFGFALKDKASVGLVFDNNRVPTKADARIAFQSRMNLAYDFR